MGSFYEVYGQLSAETMDAYRRYGRNPLSVMEKRDFYTSYLKDVVPSQVTVVAIPEWLQYFELGGEHSIHRNEEIRLYLSEDLFMTCVVSLDRDHVRVEETAGNLAYLHWRDGCFVPDRREAWRMCTGLADLRFCVSRNGRDWERTATLDPMIEVRDVVEYFRQEYERVRTHLGPPY